MTTMIRANHMTTTIRFIDCNYPGVVYTGTAAHMNGLAREGGCPAVTGAKAIVTEEEGGAWREEEAPAFWAEPDVEYYQRLREYEASICDSAVFGGPEE